jgi:DNA helicase-2/ATP-dependent DNA helicase PcrA
VLVLTRNHRSTQPLLDASNALMEGVARRFEKRLWSTRRDGPRPRLVVADDELAQARGVADAVLAEREGGLALRRQAVLFRTGTHSLALELELTRRNVPFVKYGGLRFLEAAHVKDLLAVLRWADNPASSLAALRCAKLVPGLGPAGARRLAERPADLAAFVPPPSARAGWAAFRALLEGLRDAGSRWPGELRGVLDWYRPQAERLFDDARVRLAELEQLAVLAARQTSRERFVTELALDPPAAAGDEAGAPHRDDDWLVLSTIHSAKGQEWSAVHVLHVVDGCLPADMATGSAAEIDEERRLLYVAMTRARDRLWMWLPQRFHVTQQRALGDRHLFAPPSRFLTPAVRGCCDEVASGAAPEAEARPAIDTAPLLDLGHALRRGWRA